MRRSRLTAVLLTIAIVIASQTSAAKSGSKYSLKIGFQASGYPSDQDVTAGPYGAIGDSPEIFASQSTMEYHFDSKFGRTIHGALGYRAARNVELEMGFAYTDIQLEIKQHGALRARAAYGDTLRHIWVLTDLDTRRDNDFSIVTIRPGANFTLALKSRIVPYLSAGLNMMIVRARTTLDFLRPYVTEAGGGYVLHSGSDALKEDLGFNGSQTVFGLDMGSGLEFRISPELSINFGFSYMFAFQKPFGNFEELVRDNPEDPVIKQIEYYFEGMNVSSVNATIGMILHL